MITISILPSSCIKTIWRARAAMQRSNNDGHNILGIDEPSKTGYKKHNKERFLYITKELWWVLPYFLYDA
jgi:hypothetical protein